jgi:hypothetical protein
MAAQLEIFSGQVSMGLCGEPVGFTDMGGKPLHVGDVVLTFTASPHGAPEEPYMQHWPEGMTAVVDRGEKFGAVSRYFVMGIASVPMDDPGEWRVLKVKSFDEVVPGEHWRSYGFSYREAAPQAEAA